MLSFTASVASNTRMSSQCLTLGSSKLCLQMGLTNIRFLVSFHVVPIWNPEKLIEATLCFNIRLITFILTNLVFNQNSWSLVPDHWDDTLLVKRVLKSQCLYSCVSNTYCLLHKLPTSCNFHTSKYLGSRSSFEVQ